VNDEVRHIKVLPAEKKNEAKLGIFFVAFITLAIAGLWVAKARKHDPRDLEMMKHAASATPAEGTVPELSLAATAPLSKARMDEVSRALAPAATKAASCMQGVYGTFFVDVVFAPSGQVKEARFSARNTLPVTELFKDTCVLPSLREPSIGAGPGDITATFPVRNMPSAAGSSSPSGAGDRKTPVTGK
jgi:hypothetical protein